MCMKYLHLSNCIKKRVLLLISFVWVVDKACMYVAFLIINEKYSSQFAISVCNGISTCSSPRVAPECSMIWSINSHITVKSKWPPWGERHFQINSPQYKYPHGVSGFTEFYQQISDQQQAILCSNNGLTHIYITWPRWRWVIVFWYDMTRYGYYVYIINSFAETTYYELENIRPTAIWYSTSYVSINLEIRWRDPDS